MKNIEYIETPEFKKGLKKLLKRYKTLTDDLKILKRSAIELYHINKIDNNSIFAIPSFCNEQNHSYKVKKFASKSFKGKGAKSGLRLIYIFNTETYKIYLIEIYYKGDKINENKELLKNYFESFKNS